MSRADELIVFVSLSHVDFSPLLYSSFHLCRYGIIRRARGSYFSEEVTKFAEILEEI